MKKTVFFLFLILFIIITVISTKSHLLFSLDGSIDLTGGNGIFLDENEFFLSDAFLNTGRIIGIIGFLMLGLTIFIGGSSRLFDPIFGLNVILRFHKKFALISFVLLIFHPLFILTSNVLIGLTLTDFFISYLSYLPFIAGISAFGLFFIIVIAALLFRYINYIFWLSLHRLTIIAFILAGYHLFRFGVLSGPYSIIPLLNIYIYVGIIAAFSGAIIRIISLFTKKKTISEVIDVISETRQVYSIYLKKPDNFNYKAGQFCFISFNKKGLLEPHPFTISSSPDEGHLVFTIKEVGKFTSKIKTLNKGVKVKIDGPYGVFKYKKKNSVFIAGGIGITPFRSILGGKNSFAQGQSIKLIYLNKRKENIVFHSWFDKLMEDSKYLNLHVTYVLSNENIPGYEYGHITKQIITKKVDFKEDFYICAPPKMIKSIIFILKKNKVSRKKIFHEKFSLI